MYPQDFMIFWGEVMPFAGTAFFIWLRQANNLYWELWELDGH